MWILLLLRFLIFFEAFYEESHSILKSLKHFMRKESNRNLRRHDSARPSSDLAEPAWMRIPNRKVTKSGL